jgi:hypothetical protein
MTAWPSILDVLHGPRGAVLERRFWSHVDKREPDQCWEWAASRTDLGYGRMIVGGTERLPHRVSFAIAFGWLPSAVLHKCDNPPCVNPRHLFGGTQVDNIMDMAAKWRTAGKVTPAVKSTIFALHECGMTYTAIGRQLGLSQQTVSRTVRGILHSAVSPCL